MQITWNDKDPIYRQLHDRLVELILEGVIPEGGALPSIREISSEHRINHITVAKALQMLVDGDMVEKRRGLGMYVKEGAQKKLLLQEKEKFLNDEWPAICGRIDRLGLSSADLLASVKGKPEKKS
jgi:GntR family transcriptional regulator